MKKFLGAAASAAAIATFFFGWSLSALSLPPEWVTQQTAGGHQVASYPKASGKTSENYEIIRDPGPVDCAIVHICKNFAETLPKWIAEGFSCHEFVGLDGTPVSWVGAQYKSQSAGPFYNNRTISMLVEVGEQEGENRSLNADQIDCIGALCRSLREGGLLLNYIGDYWQARTRQADIEGTAVQPGAWMRGKIAPVSLEALYAATSLNSITEVQPVGSE